MKMYYLFACAANWSIVNLRPAPPLRPMLTNSSSNGGGTTLSNPKKTQPTYEEDALVLRVIEAYCVAYQNPSRNAVHSGMLMSFLLSVFFFNCRVSYRFVFFVSLFLFVRFRFHSFYREFERKKTRKKTEKKHDQS